MTARANSNPTKTLPHDETTPLLAEFESVLDAEHGGVPQSDSEVTQHDDDDNSENQPLPFGQILLLCFARSIEPMAFFAIFPFINKMIRETGNVDEADVGFYSGLIVRQTCATETERR